jgi:hypothetical protein
MPVTVAPRPPRRILYCLPCIKKLSTYVKAVNQVDPSTRYDRENAGTKCENCRHDKGNHNCDDVPAEFNRAINILVHLQQSVAASTGEGRERRGERVVEYATKLVNAIQGFEKSLAAGVKKNKDFLDVRRRSYEENMRRYGEGLGSVGTLTPTNQEVDETLEQALLYQWRDAGNWWYLRAVWFGQVS